MENLSDYLIKNPKQVLLHLRTLTTEKCLISANFGENHSFLTAILKIDDKKQTITIDCGPKEYLNNELLSLGIVNCKADHNGIKVLFEGRGIKRAGKLGQPALSMKIPEHIYWVQRRIFYRVRSPLSKKSYCSITIAETAKENKEILPYKLFDLSATGFSILSETKELASRLIPSTEFKNCELTLDNAETHIITIIVRSNYPLNPNKPNKTYRIGCEILNISPRTESAILRYMQAIEIEMRKIFD